MKFVMPNFFTLSVYLSLLCALTPCLCAPSSVPLTTVPPSPSSSVPPSSSHPPSSSPPPSVSLPPSSSPPPSVSLPPSSPPPSSSPPSSSLPPSGSLTQSTSSLSPTQISGPTKGLRFWTFVENPSPISVTLKKGSQVISRTAANNYQDGADVEFGFFDDSATLSVQINGNTVAQYKMTVGSISGSLDTDIPPARSNPVTFINGYILSVGIMNAPAGMQDQLYVHMTLDQSNWLGNLPASTPFWALCLPGAHDAGMNTMQGLDLIKNNPALLAAAMTFLGPIIGGLIAENFEYYAVWLGGLTQKDTITNMLHMGVRFFDFRPGYAVSALRTAGLTDIRHQHTFLPGARWVDLLTEILQYLSAHQTEIIEVAISSSGFQESGMIPSATDLQNIMTQAMSAPGVDHSLQVIGPQAFKQTLAQLRASNSRLILTDSNHGPTMNNLDAWNSADWGTLDPTTMEAAYQRSITASAQSGKDQTEFQVQATATDYYLHGPDKELILSLIDANDQNLPLVQTKGQFDTTLLGFVTGYQSSLNRQEHLTILDDWADGFTVSASINITLQRLANLSKFVPN